jgi:hypothetical protein
MRVNPDSAPSVAKPMSNLDPKKTRWPDADAARSSRSPAADRSDTQRPEPDYDDSSWM